MIPFLPPPWSAALVCLGLGLFLVALYAWILADPTRALAHLDAYPRSVLPGRLLSLLCLVWFASNLWQVDFGGLNHFKPALYLLTPVAWILVTIYLSDLLSVRALCCFFLLLGHPVLVATRWQGNAASIALGVFVYVVIVKSMVLAVYPHLWKRGLKRMRDGGKLRTALPVLGLAVGGVLALCGALSLG